MNARKYAWKILHAEIRRRCSDTGDYASDPRADLLLQNVVSLISQACEEVREFDLIMQLAGFGATFAEMYARHEIRAAGDETLYVLAPPDLLRLVNRIGEGVMAEPDEEMDDDDG